MITLSSLNNFLTLIKAAIERTDRMSLRRGDSPPTPGWAVQAVRTRLTHHCLKDVSFQIVKMFNEDGAFQMCLPNSTCVPRYYAGGSTSFSSTFAVKGGPAHPLRDLTACDRWRLTWRLCCGVSAPHPPCRPSTSSGTRWEPPWRYSWRCWTPLSSRLGAARRQGEKVH